MIISKICCLGAEDIGVLTCIQMAAKCPEMLVTIVDKPEVIAKWESDRPPFTSRQLDEILKNCRFKNLMFATDYPAAIRDSEVIFLSMKYSTVDGGNLNLDPLDRVIGMIIDNSLTNKVVVDRSATPVKIAGRIVTVLQDRCEPGLKIEFLSNPEVSTDKFTVDSILNATKVLIGYVKTPSGRNATKFLTEIYERWIGQANIVCLGIHAVEDVKLIRTQQMIHRLCSESVLDKLLKRNKISPSDISKLFDVPNAEGDTSGGQDATVVDYGTIARVLRQSNVPSLYEHAFDPDEESAGCGEASANGPLPESG